jgi:enoyl-CoA hydratase/carnithine racemase
MNDSTSPFDVTEDDHGKVRVLTLNRPEKLNAFTADGYKTLTGRLDAAAADPDVAVVIVTGRGRAFSAGVDLSEMARPGGSTDLGAHFDPLLRRLASFPKPLVGAVNGLAVGFGATLLLHCDVVVIDEGALVRLPFVALGTCAEAASSWLLPRRVGMQTAAWMVLSGAALTADEAVHYGFALAKAPAGRAVDEALSMAAQMAAHTVTALVANKRLLRHGWPEAVDEVWEREKASMLAVAEELGPIGWNR